MRSRIGKSQGERTQPRADLNHTVSRPDLSEPRNLHHRIGISNKVLPQGFARRQSVAFEQLSYFTSTKHGRLIPCN